MWRLSWNLGASTSWNPQDLSRPIMGLLYFYFIYIYIYIYIYLIFNHFISNFLPHIFYLIFLTCDALYNKYISGILYEAYPGSMQPFWIYWELVAWPWSNLAAIQRRSYCASVNSHSLVGLVSRQWEAVDWAYVLCDLYIHSDRASWSANLYQCSCPFYSSHSGFFLAKNRVTQVCQHP